MAQSLQRSFAQSTYQSDEIQSMVESFLCELSVTQTLVEMLIMVMVLAVQVVV